MPAFFITNRIHYWFLELNNALHLECLKVPKRIIQCSNVYNRILCVDSQLLTCDGCLHKNDTLRMLIRSKCRNCRWITFTWPFIELFIVVAINAICYLYKHFIIKLLICQFGIKTFTEKNYDYDCTFCQRQYKRQSKDWQTKAQDSFFYPADTYIWKMRTFYPETLYQ